MPLPILRPDWLPYLRQHATLQELSGSLGDLGTFIPLTTVLAANGQIDFGSVLLWAGVGNVLSTLWFDIPIALQPMHTITSVAIVAELTAHEITAAGIVVASVVFFLGATNLIHFVAQLTPAPVVRGIQLGLGLGLLAKGFGKDYGFVHHAIKGGSSSVVWAGWDSVAVTILLTLFFLATSKRPSIPTALVAFAYGTVVAIATETPAEQGQFEAGLIVNTTIPVAADFVRGTFLAALPQLPLTLLNSVIALTSLAEKLFPDKTEHCSERRVSMSIGALNLPFLWFGAMPSCHGAGGLSAQYRFGARSALSMMFLGAVKIILAVSVGDSLSHTLLFFPKSVLGVLLAFSGSELALVAVGGMKMMTPDQTLVLLMTAGTSMAVNTGIGFVAGVVTTLVLKHASVAAEDRHLYEGISRPEGEPGDHMPASSRQDEYSYEDLGGAGSIGSGPSVVN